MMLILGLSEEHLIEDVEGVPNLFCGIFAVGGNYNLTRNNKAVNRMPYSSAEVDAAGSWVEYGHTMEDYLGGQIESGFVIDGYLECQLEDITELHFLTRAIK